MSIRRFVQSWWIAMLTVLVVHALLALYFAPPAVLGRAVPVLQDVFGAYAYNMDRALRVSGFAARYSVYDPQVLAGRPAGAVSGFGSPLFIVASSLGRLLKTDPGRFFNGAIVLSHWGVPFIGFVAARAALLPRNASVVCGAFFSAIWYFDSLVHWTWSSGRLPWAIASCLSASTLALAHAMVRRGRAAFCIAFAASGALLAIAHPRIGFVVSIFVAMFAVYELRAHRTRWPSVALSWLCAAAPLVVWWAAARTMLGDELSSPVFSSTVGQFFGDLFDLRTKGSGEGGAVRAMIRIVCFVAAAIALKRWTLGDSRARLFAPFVSGACVFAYIGGYARTEWAPDPYLWLAPAAFTASIPASNLLADVFAPAALRAMEKRAKVLLAIATIGIMPRVARTVLWFMPNALPARVARSPLDDRVSVFVGPNEAMPVVRRHESIAASWFELARFLEKRRPVGRVLVFDRGLAAFLVGATKLAVMGPLAERGAPYAASDPAAASPVDFARYLERYAVEWVVTSGDPMPFELRTDALFPAEIAAAMRCYRARSAPSYVANGTARVASSELGRIHVTEANGDTVVLRFHYDAQLSCKPDCRVTQAELPGDAAGFLRVDHPPRDFEIYEP